MHFKVYIYTHTLIYIHTYIYKGCAKQPVFVFVEGGKVFVFEYNSK